MSRVAITDNTSTLDLVFESGVRKSIHKATCTIERVEEVLHLVDCGVTPPKEYIIPFDEVTNYSFANCIEFFDELKLLLNNKYGTSSVQITNNTTTLDLDYLVTGEKYSIQKANITLEKRGNLVVVVDSIRTPAKEYQILFSDVTSPAVTDVDDLYTTILEYINVIGETAAMTDVLVDDVGGTLLNANVQRSEAIIYNRGVHPIWISYDNSPAVDKGFLLDKKEFLIEDRYIGIISAIATSGNTTNINITEVTL